MPDVFAGYSAVAAILLLVFWERLAALERWALAILLGWCLGLAVRNSAGEPQASLSSLAGSSRSALFAVAALAWLLAVAFLNWHPFDFSLGLDEGLDIALAERDVVLNRAHSITLL